MAIKALEKRRFNSNGDTYYCLTYDVTEEIREMFGVPIKEAFAVHKKATEDWEDPTKTIEVSDSPSGKYLQAYTEIIRIPEMEEIYVVFDNTHTVCFWTSEWGGIKKTDLRNIDFGG